MNSLLDKAEILFSILIGHFRPIIYFKNIFFLIRQPFSPTPSWILFPYSILNPFPLLHPQPFPLLHPEPFSPTPSSTLFPYSILNPFPPLHPKSFFPTPSSTLFPYSIFNPLPFPLLHPQPSALGCAEWLSWNIEFNSTREACPFVFVNLFMIITAAQPTLLYFVKKYYT